MFVSKLLGPAAQLTPAGGSWLSSLVSGARSEAGPMVTRETALAITTMQACVTLLAESIAQLPVDIYRRDANGGREIAADHPLYPLLRFAPNPWQTPFEYREFSQTSCGLDGNSFSFIERKPDGRPVALYPLDPLKVQVLKGPDLMPYFRIGGQDPLPQRMIHHVRWVTLNGYTGLSPIILHKDAIGKAIATSRYSSRSFANGAALAGVLQRPKEATAIKDQREIDRIIEAWGKKFGGSDNAGKVALLQEGMTFEPLSMTNVDAQLIDSMKLSSLEMARIYKVPPHMVGELDRATNNNIEHQGIQFVVYTLLSWVKRHEQAMMRDLLVGDEREKYYIEFNFSALLRGDQKTRYQAYAIGRQWGWLSINDIRRLENMPPVEGGDTYLQPLNMSDIANPSSDLYGDPSNPGPQAMADVERALNQ